MSNSLASLSLLNSALKVRKERFIGRIDRVRQASISSVLTVFLPGIGRESQRVQQETTPDFRWHDLLLMFEFVRFEAVVVWSVENRYAIAVGCLNTFDTKNIIICNVMFCIAVLSEVLRDAIKNWHDKTLMCLDMVTDSEVCQVT